MDMNDREKVQAALDKCELYLGNEKIEKENMEEYIQLILDNFFSENRLVYTSVVPNEQLLSCVFFIAGVLVYIRSQLSVDTYINQLLEASDGDFKVTYENRISVIEPPHLVNGMLPLVSRKGLRNYVPSSRWNLILEYDGKAQNRVQHYQTLKNRVDFYERIFGSQSKTKAIAFDDISYIVIDKKRADRLLDKLYVAVKGMGRKRFSELFTVAYQSKDIDCIYKYPGNLGEMYPSICICSDLAIVKKWAEEYGDAYAITMLYVADWTTIQRDQGFIQQIFNNKKIPLQVYNFFFRFALMNDIGKIRKADVYWGTTPSYLADRPGLAAVIAAEISGMIGEKYFDSAITRTEYQAVMQNMKILRQSKTESPSGFKFMCCALGLIHRLKTNCFLLEKDFKTSYAIDTLEQLYDDVGDSVLRRICREIYDFVEQLYEDICQNQYKKEKLMSLLSDNPYGNKLLVVPYANQCNVFDADDKVRYNLDIATPLKIRTDKRYSLIIISGAFWLRDVPLFLHLQAARTIFFLYEFEKDDYGHMASYAHRQLNDFEVLSGLADREEKIISRTDDGAGILEEPFTAIDISDIVKRLHSASSDSDIIQDSKVDVVRIGILDDGRQYLFSKKKVDYLNEEDNRVHSIEVAKLSPGMSFLYCRDFGNRHDVIDAILEAEKKNSDDFYRSLELVKRWKNCLAEYVEQQGIRWNDLSKQLGDRGFSNSGGAVVHSWIIPEGHVIGPRSKNAYEAIKKIIAPYDDDTTADTYYEATKNVRNIHTGITKKITNLLPRIYEAVQQGVETSTPLERMLQDDLDEFTEVLTLYDIQSLKQPVKIPGNYVNIPLESEELMSFE